MLLQIYRKPYLTEVSEILIWMNVTKMKELD